MFIDSTEKEFNHFVSKLIAPLLIMVVFVVLLYHETKRTRRNAKRKIMFAILMESVSWCYSVLTFFNLCYQWAFNETTLGYPFKLPTSSLFLAFCFLVLFFDTINKRMKRHLIASKRKKKKHRDEYAGKCARCDKNRLLINA